MAPNEKMEKKVELCDHIEEKVELCDHIWEADKRYNGIDNLSNDITFLEVGCAECGERNYLTDINL